MRLPHLSILLPLLSSLTTAQSTTTSSTTTITSTATMTKTITVSQVIAAVTSTYSISNSTTSAILATGGGVSLTSTAATSAKTSLPADYMGAAGHLSIEGWKVGGVAAVGVVGMLLF